MSPLRVTLPSATDTHAFGVELGAALRAGDLIVLAGDLGAGKTALTQGIGAGMGVQGRIASPTFVIARVHPPLAAGSAGSTVGDLAGNAVGRSAANAVGSSAGATLVHVDAYRLGSFAEVDDLDLDVSMADSVTVVEWGAGLVEQLADAHLRIELSRDADDGGGEVRTAVLTAVGGDWAARLAALPRVGVPSGRDLA